MQTHGSQSGGTELTATSSAAAAAAAAATATAASDRPHVVMSMPIRRRSLFRAVNAVNNEYDPAFPASQYGDGGSGAFVRPFCCLQYKLAHRSSSGMQHSKHTLIPDHNGVIASCRAIRPTKR